MQEAQTTGNIENKRVLVRAILDKWGCTKAFCKERNEQAIWYLDEATHLEEADAIRSRGLTSTLSDMPHGSYVGNPTQNAALEVLRLAAGYQRASERLRQECEEAVRLQMVVDELLDKLPREQKTVICMMYRDREDRPPTWDKIGEVMGYSEDWAKTLERRAVDWLGENMYVTL